MTTTNPYNHAKIMKKAMRYMLGVAIMLLAGNASAQNLNSAYFLDGYTYGHEMNPAKAYDRKGYVAFPGLSHINFGVHGNLNLKNLLYKNPNGEGLTTFLNPNLSVKEVMGNFHNNNKLLLDSRVEVFGFGFRGFHGFNTFNIAVRANGGANIPYELFDVMKNLQNKDYDISDVGATASGWVEVGLGHSHQINKAWRFGAKMKILLGGARADVKADNLSLDLSAEDKWTATANASVEASMKGLTWGQLKTKERSAEYMKRHPEASRTYQEVDFDNLDVKDPGIGGGGVAFDFGTEWDMGKQDLVKGLKLSAALLDLGFIKWNNTLTAANRGGTFEFDGFHDVKVGHGDGVKIEDQWEDVDDRLEDLYQLEAGETTSKVKGLGATLNIGLEYALPSYDKLSFGLLSTTRIQGVYSWNEERVSISLSPAKAFEFALSAAVGTQGASVGGVINIHPRGLNLFIGMDHVLGKLSKQYVPLKSNADFTFGINIPFGKVREN